MSIITAIEPGRRRGRFNIYVDGDFVVAAGERVVAELSLHVGREFSPGRLTEITQAEEQRRAMQSAVRLLELRARSSREIADRLRQKGYEDETAVLVIDALKRMNLIDDAQFAQDWIASRNRVRPKGARMLRAELAGKGVSRDEIDSALAPISSDDELVLARDALQFKLSRTGLPENADERKAVHQRLVSFLQRRGFRWDTIKSVLAEVFDSGELEE